MAEETKPAAPPEAGAEEPKSNEGLTPDDLEGVDEEEEEAEDEQELPPDPGTAPQPQPRRRTGKVLTRLQRARLEMEEASEAVNAARRELDEAARVQQAKCKAFSQLESEMRESVSLHDLNRVQREATRVEDARRFRALQALDAIGRDFRPGPRNYPPVNPVGSKEK